MGPGCVISRGVGWKGQTLPWGWFHGPGGRVSRTWQKCILIALGQAAVSVSIHYSIHSNISYLWPATSKVSVTTLVDFLRVLRKRIPGKYLPTPGVNGMSTRVEIQWMRISQWLCAIRCYPKEKPQGSRVHRRGWHQTRWTEVLGMVEQTTLAQNAASTNEVFWLRFSLRLEFEFLIGVGIWGRLLGHGFVALKRWCPTQKPMFSRVHIRLLQNLCIL